QVMDQESINTDSFVVQKNDQPDGSGSWSRVPGRLEKQARMVRFYPDEAWEEGVLYRYILGSDQDTSAVSATIRDIRQYPLQTKILAQDPDDAPEAEDGGPDLVNHFLGAPETENVFQVLRNLPAIDVNSNFYYDQQEDSPAEGKPAEDYIDVDTGDDYGDVVKNDNYIVEENSAMMAIDEVGGWADGAYFDREQYFEWEDYDGKPDWDFTWYTHALNVEVLGPAEYDGFDDDYTGKAVKVNIFPTRLMASNLDMVVDVSLLGEEDNPTGPQIIRMRYEKEDTDEGQSPRIKPITGWIKETGQGPVFETEVDCYLDAPYLEPTAGMSHNLHSYGQEEDEEFTLKLRGRIIFLDDGRMVIRQINTNMVPIDVHVWGEILEIDVDVDIYLQIPKGGNFLNYMQLPIKQ
ncbi:MAG: hypothetical protein ACOC0W_09290, partial [Desulfosalsimonas sp.]